MLSSQIDTSKSRESGPDSSDLAIGPIGHWRQLRVWQLPRTGIWVAYVHYVEDGNQNRSAWKFPSRILRQLSGPFSTVDLMAILVGRCSHGAQEPASHRISAAESAGGSDLFEALVRSLQLPDGSRASWKNAIPLCFANASRSFRFGLLKTFTTICQYRG